MNVWNKAEVTDTTRRLEERIVRRLAKRGVELRLSEDPYDPVDGITVKDGVISSVCEIKTRSSRLDELIEWGTVLFDHSKLNNLRSAAFKYQCQMVLLVLTADDFLLWCNSNALHKVERRNARKNHHSTEYIRKDVELVPIHRFALFDSEGGRIDWTWEEIGAGADPKEYTQEIEERAAVMHFDGGVESRLAYRIAEYEVKKNWEARKIR